MSYLILHILNNSSGVHTGMQHAYVISLRVYLRLRASLAYLFMNMMCSMQVMIRTYTANLPMNIHVHRALLKRKEQKFFEIEYNYAYVCTVLYYTYH